MKMRVSVYYKHTFGYDVFECNDLEEVFELAIKSIQRDLGTTDDSIFPVQIESENEMCFATTWTDFIEEIIIPIPETNNI